MRRPDYEGWLYPYAHRGGEWAPRRVRIWLPDDEPVAPDEWHGCLFVEGHEEYDPPRTVPGGSPLQAAAVTFQRMLRIAEETGGYVA